MSMWTPPEKLYTTPREEETVKDIYLAAIEGDDESVAHALENGARIDHPGNPSNGWGPFGKKPGFQGTPLHYAVAYGNVSTAKLLLKHGARTDIRTRSGYLAREYAEKRGYTEMIELLKEYEKNNTMLHGATDDSADFRS